MDVLWIEPSCTWLESSQLLGSDLVSSRLFVAEVLVVSCREVSMVVVVWLSLLGFKLGWFTMLRFKLVLFTVVESKPLDSIGKMLFWL